MILVVLFCVGILVGGTLMDLEEFDYITPEWKGLRYVSNKPLVGACPAEHLPQVLETFRFSGEFQTFSLFRLEHLLSNDPTLANQGVDQVVSAFSQLVGSGVDYSAENVSLQQYVEYLIQWTRIPSHIHLQLLDYNQRTTADDDPLTAESLWNSLGGPQDIRCHRLMFWYNTAILPEYGNPTEHLQVDYEPVNQATLPSVQLLNVVHYFQQMVSQFTGAIIRPRQCTNGDDKNHHLSNYAAIGISRIGLLTIMDIMLRNIPLVAKAQATEVFALCAEEVPGFTQDTFARIWIYIFERIQVPLSLHQFLIDFNLSGDSSISSLSLHGWYLCSRGPIGPRVSHEVMLHWYENVILSHVGRSVASLQLTRTGDTLVASVSHLVNLLQSETAHMLSCSQRCEARLRQIFFFIQPIPFTAGKVLYWTSETQEELTAVKRLLDKWDSRKSLLQCVSVRGREPPVVERAAKQLSIRFVITESLLDIFAQFHARFQVSQEVIPITDGLITEWIEATGNRLQQTPEQIAAIYRVLVAERSVGTAFSIERDMIYEGTIKDYPIYRPKAKYLAILLEREKQRVSALLSEIV